VAELIAGIFTASRYKRSQGKAARQITFAALVVTIAIGCWRLSSTQIGSGFAREYGIPLALLAIGVWASFRIVNIPRFADFLISVEAEMNKVSWPSKPELFRASMVVIVVIFLLTAILFSYDIILKTAIGWLLGTNS
jgi:preprotein translocase subunit SecE